MQQKKSSLLSKRGLARAYETQLLLFSAHWNSFVKGLLGNI